MSDRPGAITVNGLLLATGKLCWLVPATLVAEVVAHFDGSAATLLSWRGLQLPCLDDTDGRARAFAVLRRVAGVSRGFYALALNEPPYPLQVDAGMLGVTAGEEFELLGRRVHVFDASSVEARLPSA